MSKRTDTDSNFSEDNYPAREGNLSRKSDLLARLVATRAGVSSCAAQCDYDRDALLARLDETIQVLTGTALEGDLATRGGGAYPP